MSQASPTEAGRCPECGAAFKEGESKCWLCQRATLPSDSPSASSLAATESKPAGQFSLASMLLVITLIAVCLGSYQLAPGLGVLLAVVAAPALVRTCVVGSWEKQAGRSLTIGEKVVVFLASSAIIVLVGVAGIIAFQIACWGSCAMVAGIQQKESEGALLVGLGTGAIAGLGTIGWLIWKTWPRRKP